MKDLTISNIERQNVLNNRFAVSKVQEHLDIEGMLFEGEYRFTKKMVADFYQVDTSTIDRYLQSNSDELKHNGYILCKGKQLKEFKLEFAHLINEASKTTQLGLFNFRSFLNIGMLLTESEKAKKVRSLILDFVITTIRTSWGMPLSKLKSDFGDSLYQYCLRMAQSHLKQGKLEITNHVLRLTESGIFVSDGIMSDMLWVED
mgnify:CR=1 FL=1